MDTLTFISNLIESVAWPLAILLIIFLMKDDLSRLLLNIKRFKHKDTEIDFEMAVHEVSQELEPDNNSMPEREPDDLTLLSPRGSIIESWLRVEDSLRQFNERHGIEGKDKKPFRSSHNVLQILDYDVLGKSTIVMLDKLRKLRNEAVHLNDASITSESALEYRNMANRVIKIIEKA